MSRHNFRVNRKSCCLVIISYVYLQYYRYPAENQTSIYHPGPQPRRQQIHKVASVLTSDAIDTPDPPIQAERGVFPKGSEELTEKNQEALRYIHDYGDINNKTWLRYTEYAGLLPNGNKLFRCVHQKKQKRGGSSTTECNTEICGFGALRQTVKRHVEATHLGIA